MSLYSMKEKNFIIKSRYPGGKDALKEFIKQNLKYPKEALENKIEGNVLVKFKVNSLGKVHEATIVKGIQHECNKEAIRVVQKLKYPKRLNRKLQVTTNKKITIKFRLPKTKTKLTINYEIVK